MALLDTLYAYQAADLEVDKLDAQLRATPEYARYAKLRSYITEQRRVLQRMTAALESRQAQIKQVRENLTVLEQRFADGNEKFEAADQTDLAEVEKFRKYFEQMHARLSQERREFTDLVTTLEKEDALLSDMRVKLSRANKEYEETKVIVEEQLLASKDEKDALVENAKKLEEKVSKDLLEKYNDIKRSKMPPVALVEQNRCCGCNMELAAVTMSKLKEDAEAVECDNCGRILFLQS